MTLGLSWFRAAAALWRRPQMECDLEEEFHAHIEYRTEDLIKSGVSPADARRLALVEFGGYQRYREECFRESDGVLLRLFGQNTRYTIRGLLRKPGFTFAAISTLMLGIGVNTALFSIVNAVLLKPLAVHDPDGLVACVAHPVKNNSTYQELTYAEFRELRLHREVFNQVSAHNLDSVELRDKQGARQIIGDWISSDYFDTLGVHLARGRAFSPEEERPESGIPVAIVSFSFWDKSGRKPDIIGSTIRIDGRVFTVVGVTPVGFTGATRFVSPALYLPLGMYGPVHGSAPADSNAPTQSPQQRTLTVLGRLQSGLTRSTADQQLIAIANRLAELSPGPPTASFAQSDKETFQVVSVPRIGDASDPEADETLLWSTIALFCLSGAVLLVAGLNVATMMLTRATARRREIAIRLAIGAGRGQLIAQLLTESLLLSLMGGIGAIAAAGVTTILLRRALTHLLPIEMDVVLSSPFDPATLFATFVFCLASTIIFGLAPAWRASRSDLVQDLKPLQLPGKRRLLRLLSAGNLLVIGQLAMCLMLLTVAFRQAHSIYIAERINTGLDVSHLMIIHVDPSLAGYDFARSRIVYNTIRTQLMDLPGVDSTTTSAVTPFSGIQPTVTIHALSNGPQHEVKCRFNSIGAQYFHTTGISLLRGRDFLPSDIKGNGQTSVVIDEAAVMRLWPNEDPVGRRIRVTGDELPEALKDAVVIGVAANVHDEPTDSTAQPHLYLSSGQQPQSEMTIFLRTRNSIASQKVFASQIREKIMAVDPSLVPISTIQTLQDSMKDSLSLWTIRTREHMFVGMGVLTLFLAVIGLYAIRSYSIVRRTREIGIRMALGATIPDIIRRILIEGLQITAVGTLVGIFLSYGAIRVLNSVSPTSNGTDLFALGAAALVLCATSLVACFIPAQRASRVAPTVALRSE